MTRTTTVLTVAGVTLISGLCIYAAYFDYKRRNDPSFRKKLRKEKKKVDKHVAETQSSTESTGVSADDLREVLEKIRSEETPASPQEKEQFFMTQVGMGEQIASQGPSYNLQAASYFFRALRVYPSPVELIVIYQKTIPESIFKIVVELMNMDVKERVEGYYNYFPPKSMNVKVTDVTDTKITSIKKKILIADKDFKAGDIIYKEQPVVAVLDPDLEGKGTYCTHCLRQVHKGMAIRAEDDRLGAVYCSKDCQLKSKTQSQNLLFGSEPLLPPSLAPDPDAQTKVKRIKAQTAFVEYLKRPGKATALLVARFWSRQVAVEVMKMIPSAFGTPATEVLEEGGYTFYDHIERLRYIDMTVSDEEIQLLVEVLKTALEGIENFINKERHSILCGKMAYNAIGICFAGGRDDKPISTDRPEDMERSRTPYGTSRQMGCGYYAVSSYLAHSCDPSARPSFSSGTSELTLVASRDVKQGEELTMAYVDVSQRHDETLEEARRRRRMELARGWKFACTCSRCLSEGGQNGGVYDGMPIEKDESRVEDIVKRLEGAA